MRKTKILTAILFALVVVALSATASAESCPRLAYEYEQEHIFADAGKIKKNEKK